MTRKFFTEEIRFNDYHLPRGLVFLVVLAWLLFIAGMVLLAFTLAHSAAIPAADWARFRTPASMAASGVAAVRAGSHARPLEDPSPASEHVSPFHPLAEVTTSCDDPARSLAT